MADLQSIPPQQGVEFVRCLIVAGAGGDSTRWRTSGGATLHGDYLLEAEDGDTNNQAELEGLRRQGGSCQLRRNTGISGAFRDWRNDNHSTVVLIVAFGDDDPTTYTSTGFGSNFWNWTPNTVSATAPNANVVMYIPGTATTHMATATVTAGVPTVAATGTKIEAAATHMSTVMFTAGSPTITIAAPSVASIAQASITWTAGTPTITAVGSNLIPMAITRTVILRMENVSGEPMANATIEFVPIVPPGAMARLDDAMVIPEPVTVTLDPQGLGSVELFPFVEYLPSGLYYAMRWVEPIRIGSTIVGQKQRSRVIRVLQEDNVRVHDARMQVKRDVAETLTPDPDPPGIGLAAVRIAVVTWGEQLAQALDAFYGDTSWSGGATPVPMWRLYAGWTLVGDETLREDIFTGANGNTAVGSEVDKGNWAGRAVVWVARQADAGPITELYDFPAGGFPTNLAPRFMVASPSFNINGREMIVLRSQSRGYTTPADRQWSFIAP